jgi:hypothetical protein
MTVYWTPTATPIITPVPTTTYGEILKNITDTKFNIVLLPGNVMSPYGFLSMGIMSVPYFLIFMAYFLSLWISHGNLKMASIVGILFGVMFLVSTGGLGIGLPAEMAPLAYGALAASCAGYIMSMFKNI